MRRERTAILIFVVSLCLSGIWGLKENIVVRGAVVEISDIIAPHDIPAVAVEVNKDSEMITEKLSEVFYTVYTEADTLHIPVSWDVSSVNMNVTGVYKIKGTLKLSAEYNPGEIQIPQVQTTVSVQYPDRPDIHTYYRLTAAGLYIFPWLKQENCDSMQAYLKKDNGQWINLTEEGFALCDEEGLYVSNQSMIAGNTYSLLVTYNNGKKQTGTLRFQYRKGGSLKIYSYQYSHLGSIQRPGKTICSYDTKDEKYLRRCAAYAVKTEGSLEKIEKELKESVRLHVSTSEKFENTAENPEIVLKSSWDMSQVKISRPGVYKVTGTFKIPEGYETADGLVLPKAYAYISVQKKGEPQINTYSMPTVDLLEFPMLMDGFSAEERQNMQIYLSENKGSYQKVDKELTEVTSTGIQLYFREILKKGKSYDICAVYEKGSTGIYTFTYNDAFIVNEYWHERNFSDRNERNLPDIVQNSPEQPGSPDTTGSNYYSSGSAVGQENADRGTDNSRVKTAVSAESESTVTELSTGSITAVSGQRLLLMLQQNGNVKFEKQGISAIFSSDTVNGWKISADDEIQIRIEKTTETAFSLRIFVRGEEVTEIPGTVVEFLASVFTGIQSPETAKAEDTLGNQYTVSYQTEQKVLRLEISQTGDYFLTDENTRETQDISDWTDAADEEFISDEEYLSGSETEKTAEDSGVQPFKKHLNVKMAVPIVLIVCAIVFAIICSFWRKRR